LSRLFTGEVGLAFFPKTESGYDWLLVLPCSTDPQAMLQTSQSMMERNRTQIHSPDRDWQNSVCWAAVAPGTFRLNGNFLLLASTGALMLSTLDQLTTGSSFAGNRDFARQIAQAEDGHGLLVYLNLPEIAVREYPNLSQIMRTIYPRSSGLNSRPPLAMIRRYARGATCFLVPHADGGFTRATVQAPLPSFLAMAGGSILRFPMNLRADGREGMQKSRDNMKFLWLKLQEYASRFGHFPDNPEDLRESLSMENLTEDGIDDIFTAPASLSRLTPEEAAASSYTYLAGLIPGDEPDIPLVYESQPWSEDFIGMYPQFGQGAAIQSAPAETGDFLPFRQFIQLNGEVVTMTERRFREKIMPRLAERE
ncbi:MAG: hypothetical protein LBE84_07050, partial [Planctomycetota bacterium]|nr:hypothetical protein [Planctomycetota bacterium]